MSLCEAKVSVAPGEALRLVADELNADLVHSELHELGGGKEFGVYVFEKYFMRVGNRAALTVVAENTGGATSVRAIATGSSQGVLFNFDWGAADDFAFSVKDILKQYIVEP